MSYDNVTHYAYFNVGSYGLAGKPYLTSSFCSVSPQAHIEFPFVTRFLTVKVSSSVPTDTVYVAVHSGGFQTSNYFTLINGDTFSTEWGICDLYVKALAGTIGFEVAASLTPIPRASLLDIDEINGYLTGSGIHGS